MLARRHRNSGRQHEGKRFPAHLQHVRGFCCLVASDQCEGRIEAAHTQDGGRGIGMKASDAYTVPLCAGHHAEQHRIGWQTFQKQHGIDAVAAAMTLARQSPSLIRAAWVAGYDVGQESEA